MFEYTSRYFTIDQANYEDPSGRIIRYKRRRFVPQGGSLPLQAETAVHPTERLDTLAARALGAPTAFWRLCDANNVLNPDELLIQEQGRTIRVPIPQPE